MLLPLCGAVPSAPQYGVPLLATLKGEYRISGVLALVVGA
jgi:hypothetical protein